MTRLILALGLVLAAAPALAQQAEPSKPDPLESAVAAEWQALQTQQSHMADAIGKLIEQRRKEHAAAVALAEWWKRYVDGLATIQPGAPQQ